MMDQLNNYIGHFYSKSIYLLVARCKLGRLYNATGFMFETDNNPPCRYLITVGHFVVYIRDNRSKIDCISVSNNFGFTFKDILLEDMAPGVIPIDNILGCYYEVKDDISDFAYLSMDSFILQSAIASKTVFVKSTNIAKESDSFDQYYLVGIPHETLTSDGNLFHNWDVIDFKLNTLKVSRSSERSEIRYSGFILDNEVQNVNNISGMSGGLIVGLNNDGLTKIVAIQNSWLPSKKKIYGTFLSYFLDDLKKKCEGAILDNL